MITYTKLKIRYKRKFINMNRKEIFIEKEKSLLLSDYPIYSLAGILVSSQTSSRNVNIPAKSTLSSSFKFAIFCISSLLANFAKAKALIN